MPNWCINEINISGSEEDIEKFLELVTEEFDFNKIIPMPEELSGISSSPEIVTQEEYEKEKQRQKDAEKEGKEYGVNITQQLSSELIDKYGCNNSYDWRIKNWGTKWLVSDEHLICEKEKDWLYFEFYTAWAPPEPICHKLRKLFPNLEICWFYREDGNQIVGWIK